MASAGSAPWLKAALADGGVCLKLRLKPYCLGHELLLQRLGSPLAGASTAAPTPEDLLLAALVCSESFEDAQASLKSPFLMLFVRFWRWRLGSVSWLREIVKFRLYRTQGAWCPEINRPVAGRALKAPWIFRLFVLLKGPLGYTEHEAWNMPMAKAHVLWAARGDQEGNLDLFGPADQALLDKVAALEASQKAEEGAWA